MRTLYENNTANYPRLKTDKFWIDYENHNDFQGIVGKTLQYVMDYQLLREDLWKRFVDQFKQENADAEGGWRGEYWGKMMRGACFVYSCNQDEKLYDILTNTVIDMMSAAEENGRISSYGVDIEFTCWDMWCRKYVLLGMQYYLEICKDEALKAQIIECMCGQVDYITDWIGDPSECNPKGESKKDINKTTANWRGLNSSSILEPVVRLYSLTGEQKYLDFAEYIVEKGGTSVANIFELADQDQLYPYQYPMTKAYEMTSCFEGLLEYYRITGIEKHKLSVIKFADKVLESDFTIIGSSGCTHELFDHSSLRQCNTTNGELAQETCVTVTLMKFLYQLTLLTGQSKYVDAFETAFYNAYLGALNIEQVIEPKILRDHADWAIEALPFDSYSPLTAGTRGNGIGGLKLMSDNHYYGCCACIGSAGIGLIGKMAVLTTKKGFVMNLFVPGSIDTVSAEGVKVCFETQTEYPAAGTVKIVVKPQQTAAFELLIRKPHWSKETVVKVNGENMSAAVNDDGYMVFDRTWNAGDEVELVLDMRTRVQFPVFYEHDILMTGIMWQEHYAVPVYDVQDPAAMNHIALLRGPIVLAQENRLGYSVDDAVDIVVDEDGYVDVKEADQKIAAYPNQMELTVPLRDGSRMHVTDYASAGKLWTEESKMAAWMKTV